MRPLRLSARRQATSVCIHSDKLCGKFHMTTDSHTHHPTGNTVADKSNKRGYTEKAKKKCHIYVDWIGNYWNIIHRDQYTHREIIQKGSVAFTLPLFSDRNSRLVSGASQAGIAKNLF